MTLLSTQVVDEFQRYNENRRNICVIGAGPGGLAAVKIIKDSPQYKDGLWTVTAFEARDNVGGIWLPAPPTGDPPLTPLYDSLTTNLPHPVMAYPSFPFPPETALFPPASTVQRYLEAYAAHFELSPHIRLNTPVQSATRNAITGKWTVVVRPAHAPTPADETLEFDHLIVANGHYRVPRLPTTPGLAAWLDAQKAFHAVRYRNPDDFRDARTVLVVGAGPSGQDLVTDLLASGRTVVHSATGAVREDMRDGRLKVRGRVQRYLEPPSEGKVLFEDGTEEAGVDCVVLATGYKVDFPFLPESVVKQALPPGVPPLPSALYNSTYHVFPLARHIFPLSTEALPASSIAFLGLPVRVAPLPLLEAQMRAVLRVFAHPQSLDPTEEAIDIVARYEALQNQGDPVELAIARAWHRCDGHEQFAYRDALHAFAGHDLRVPGWEIEMYDAKGVLREEWRDLERAGLADEWVRGVGKGGGEKGVEEWVGLMRRLLKRAEERHPERSRL
ncbi:FAD/NAD-P-binding domain-containing protein [Trametes polyzona]|nr:FAD/NAD-P-binding domain-containing protein [Trametes polyzona]